jgi:hypothetical protein
MNTLLMIQVIIFRSLHARFEFDEDDKAAKNVIMLLFEVALFVRIMNVFAIKKSYFSTKDFKYMGNSMDPAPNPRNE